MQLLESEWFFRMVERQSRTASDRLVEVFRVTEQWLTAPGIREQIEDVSLITASLRDYLVETARAAGAADPEGLSVQLLMLLQGAVAEELRNREAHALRYAAEAAQVVVARACRDTQRRLVWRWSVAASLLIAAVSGLLWFEYVAVQEVEMVAQTPDTTFMRTVVPVPGGVDPTTMAAAFSLQKKVEHGICPPPHLHTLPTDQMTAYMNVISYRKPENPLADRAHLKAFLAWYEDTMARECYYPPIPRATVYLR
jgi:hypothetical protein